MSKAKTKDTQPVASAEAKTASTGTATDATQAIGNAPQGADAGAALPPAGATQSSDATGEVANQAQSTAQTDTTGGTSSAAPPLPPVRPSRRVRVVSPIKFSNDEGGVMPVGREFNVGLAGEDADADELIACGSLAIVPDEEPAQ